MSRARAVLAFAAAWGSVAVGPGCGCGAVAVTPPVVPSSAPSSTAPPLASEESPKAAPPVDLSSAEPLLADPRLAAVAKAADDQDYAGAAARMEEAMRTARPEGDDAARFAYQLGRLHSAAKHATEAHAAFAKAASSSWILAPYAACAAAAEAVREGKHDDAIRLASSVPVEIPVAATCALTEAEAHEAKHEDALALAIYERHLASAPKPARWADVSVRAARLLLATNDPTNAERALVLARRVAIELPSSPLGKKGAELEAEAVTKVAHDRRAALERRPKEDALARAAALVEAGKAEDGAKAAEEIEASLSPAEKNGELGCRAAQIVAKAKTRRRDRAEAADAWGTAIERCTDEARVTALYQGGIASHAAGRAPEAATRFERLEREFPKHRLADDARVRGAQAVLAMGDEARFSSMLERIADDYPDGDMTSDGLFRLALHRIEKNDWAGATSPLDAAMKARPHEHEYWSAGRAAYFHARALAATGDKARAADELAAVVREFPLGYYMALAYARLAEMDPKRAESVLDEATKRETEPLPPLPDREAFHRPGFARAIELLRQGEVNLAKGEIAALGLATKDVDPGVLWTLAALYERAGAFQLAHAIPRGKISDWLDHWPVATWRSAWEIAYPRPFRSIVEREAKASNVPASLIWAIMREESAFDPQASSAASAYGLMQIIVPTGQRIGKKLGLVVSEATLKTPAVNIAVGARFLATLRGEFDAQPALAIPAYNAGAGAPKRWLAERPYDDFDVFVERIPYEETRNYTKRVLKSYAAYLYLYEPDRLAEVFRLPLRAMPKAVLDRPPPPDPSLDERAEAP